MLLFVAIISAGCLLVTFCNCIFWPKVRITSKRYSKVASVLIPARNEEKNLPRCLDSVIEQGLVVAEILVYNDHSTDSTLQIINEYEAQFSSIKLVSVSPLPSGWCGKPFACVQLAKQAKGDWLLFMDADTRLTPNAINRMLFEAQTRQVTFLSCWPKFQMESIAEKILMPILNFVVFSLFPSPLLFLKRPEFDFKSQLGLAHGACMLFQRSAYEKFGGHEKVKDQIFEDTRIAQLWRASGRQGICLDGQDIVYLRMYSSFSEIWAGFQKNIFPAFQNERSFWMFLSLHVMVFLFPFVWGLIHNTSLLLLIISFVLLARLLLIIRFRHSLLSILFHPVGELVLVLIGLTSWWHCKYGSGVVWKGRKYQ